MKKIIRRGDVILFLFFILAAVLAAVIPLLRASSDAQYVRITCRGEEYGVYPLHDDNEITVSSMGHTNIIEIRDGTVTMSFSDCHNQICVDTGAISRTGETIVCLPNRVVVEITGGREGGDQDEGIDAIVR